MAKGADFSRWLKSQPTLGVDYIALLPMSYRQLRDNVKRTDGSLRRAFSRRPGDDHFACRIPTRSSCR